MLIVYTVNFSKVSVLVYNSDSDIKSLNAIGQAIIDKKGFNVMALDVRKVCSMTDYFIIAEGSVDRHVRALAQAAIAASRDEGLSPLRVDGLNSGDWIVIDCGSIFVHLFTPDMRDRYAIEQLWHEGDIVDLTLDYGPPTNNKYYNQSSGTSA